MIDCETTGLNVRTDDIITIAAIKIRGNRIALGRDQIVEQPDRCREGLHSVSEMREVSLRDAAYSG